MLGFIPGAPLPGLAVPPQLEVEGAFYR